jgi:hypothetical protein
MDPNSTKSPGLALPNLSTEGGVRTSMPVQPPEGSHEVMMPAVEVMPSNGAAVPIAAPPIAPVTNPIPQPIAAPLPDPSATTVANVADDTNSDELDAEWVRKAKAIVEQTKEDPHRESHELGKVKADYMRIRYNKNIKVVEE